MFFNGSAFRANILAQIYEKDANEKLVGFLSLLIAVCMIWPLDHLVSVFCIILFVHWFFTVDYNRLIYILCQRWLIFLPILLWLLYFWLNLRPEISASNWVYDLEKRLSLLIFGLVIGCSRLSNSRIKKIWWAYVISCLVLFMSMFVLAAQNSINFALQIPFYERMGGQNLAQTLNLHRVYTGMHLLWAAILCVWLIADSKKNARNSLNQIYFLCFTFVIMVFGMILLSGRGPFLAGFVVAVLALIIHFDWLYKKTIYWVYCLIFIGLVVVAAWFLPVSRRFIKQTLYVSSSGIMSGSAVAADDQSGPLASRMFIWRASINQIERHWVLGVGSGVTTDSISAAGRRLGIDGVAKSSFNAHNQYLESWLQLGLSGILALLAILFIPIWFAFKSKNFLIVYFLAMFAVCMVSESMFNVQKGIVPFAFFYALLHLHFYTKSSNPSL